MAHNTRSRRALGALDVKAAGKTNAKHTAAAAAKVVKEKSNGKVKSSSANKSLEQNENVVPIKKVGKTTNKKKSQLKASEKENNPAGGTVLGLKSPALRDRTNRANEMASEKAAEVPAKKTSEVKASKVSKKTVSKKNAKKTEQKVDEVVSSDVSSNDYSAEAPVAKEKLYSAREIEDMLNKDQEMNIHPKKVSKGKKAVKVDKVPAKKDHDEKAKESMRGTKTKQSNVSKQKNMSMEEVEDLLNDDVDEEIDEVETNEKNNDKSNNKRKADSAELSDDEEDNSKVQKLDGDKDPDDFKSSVEKNKKKFFKYKNVEEEIKPTTAAKRPRRQVTRKKAKAADDDESDLDVLMENKADDKESAKPVKKALRRKASKNYCELSQRSQNSSSVAAKKAEDEKVVEPADEGAVKANDNHLPIYKKIRLSQESVKDKEEIYEFLYDSQDSAQKAQKKKRKPVKRLAKKGVKKVAKSKPVMPQKKLKKTTKDQQPQQKGEIERDNAQTKHKVPNIVFSNEIPDDIPDVENAAVQQAPAIKILSNQKLTGNKKINLMATPNIPKTITSELKLYGPKNAITSKPTSVYKNMVNHSLIRQSMSPINKLNNEDFDAGSPWRPIDAFSRVKKVVQSTPQIIKPFMNREKKIKIPMHVSEKSICSADTIHASSIDNDGAAANMEKAEQNTKNQASPRKFGTEISNTSPLQSKSVENIHEAKTLIQNKSLTQAVSMQSTINGNQQSPAKVISPLSAFTELPVENEFPEAPAYVNNENTLQSPSKQKKTKFSSPSPFRLEKRRPAATEKHEPTKLKQSNLNAFLNLKDMPESTCIATTHGIFDDIPAEPISAKNSKKPCIELNVENAFGFDCDTTDEASALEPAPKSKFATVEDVRRSLKGKVFPNARIKSALPTRVTSDVAKKAMLKAVLDKKNQQEEKMKENANKNSDDSSNDSDETENNDSNNPMTNQKDWEMQNKEKLLNAVSFSDTFDVFSENGDLESKIPEEVPLFVDLEPVHFSKPPRRSYNKRKREVCFDTSKEDESDDDNEEEVKRKKLKHKKKKGHLNKEEQKRMQDWVKSINETFEEIDHFDLVVE